MPIPRRPDVTSLELVGGPEPVTVGIHDYNPSWPAVFAEHRDRIRLALAGQHVEIAHIGSTSVPGLAAKPIIDILVTVDDITAEEDYLDALLEAGYELRVREPGHRLVRTPERNVHAHVYEHDARAVDEYLLLRDRLRTDATDRALYELEFVDNHHHLQCIVCGRVEDVECSVGHAPCLIPSRDHGMRVLEATVTFRAICSDCERNGHG